MTTTLTSVPHPGRTPSRADPARTTTPTVTSTAPNDSPVIRVRPECRTSHGDRPRSTRTVSHTATAHRARPATNRASRLPSDGPGAVTGFASGASRTRAVAIEMFLQEHGKGHAE